MLMVPPIASPSWSGVSVLVTSRLSTKSEGMTSRATFRRSLSGAGTFRPLMLATLSCGSMPRTPTKRPSPWSRSMNTPLILCRASLTFSSGNWPIESLVTTEMRLSAERMRLIAP